MHSPSHLPRHLASLLHPKRTSEDSLDDESPYLSSNREDLLSPDVAYARTYYMDVWRHCSKKSWECRIDVKYPNPSWTFAEGLCHHEDSTEPELAPEEILEEDGQIHQAEAWVSEHPDVPPPCPTRWNKLKVRLINAKEAGKRRLSHASTSASSHISQGTALSSKESLQHSK